MTTKNHMEKIATTTTNPKIVVVMSNVPISMLMLMDWNLMYFPSFLGGEVAAETTDTSSDASSFPGKGAYSRYEINDFRFICINNNNNNLVEGEEPQVPPTPPGLPEPTTATLTVKKQVFGCDNFPHSPIIMECEDLQNDSSEWLNCNDNNNNVDVKFLCNPLAESLLISKSWITKTIQ